MQSTQTVHTDTTLCVLSPLTILVYSAELAHLVLIFLHSELGHQGSKGSKYKGVISVSSCMLSSVYLYNNIIFIRDIFFVYVSIRKFSCCLWKYTAEHLTYASVYFNSKFLTFQ